MAIALPDQGRFRDLVAETEAPLHRLRVAVLFVTVDGKVEGRIGYPLDQRHASEGDA